MNLDRCRRATSEKHALSLHLGVAVPSLFVLFMLLSFQAPLSIPATLAILFIIYLKSDKVVSLFKTQRT